MKSNLAKVSLALLSAVFILGCQDLGPAGPDGLVPQFDKKGLAGTPCPPPSDLNRDDNGHCHDDDGDTGGDDPGSPFYQYTFISSVITTDPSPAIGVRGTPSGNYVNLSCGNDCFDDELLKLSKDLLLDNIGSDRDACFFGGEPFTPRSWIGAVSPVKGGGNELFANLLFRAHDKLGNEIGYRLRLFGSANGIFPPEFGVTVTVAFTTYFIEPSRNKEKNACSGAGNLNDLLTTSIVILGASDATL